MFSRKSTRRFATYIFIAALVLTSCNAGATAAPTLDVDALKTAVVETTIAQISVQSTQTALAIPTNTSAPAVTDTGVAAPASPTLDPSVPTPTTDVSLIATRSFDNTQVAGATVPVVVLPTTQPTAALGDACNNNVFQGDVTIPDGTVLKPGEDFVKQWSIKNTGNCTWDEGYTLVYVAGSKPDLDPYDFKFKKSEDFVSPGESINVGVRLTTPCTPGKYEGHWRMRNDKGYFFGTLLSVYVEVKDKCK